MYNRQCEIEQNFQMVRGIREGKGRGEKEKEGRGKDKKKNKKTKKKQKNKAFINKRGKEAEGRVGDERKKVYQGTNPL